MMVKLVVEKFINAKLVQITIISFPIDLPLSIDQIRCNIHQVKHLINSTIPTLQHLVLMLNRFKIYNITNPIHPTIDHFVIVQSA